MNKIIIIPLIASGVAFLLSYYLNITDFWCLIIIAIPSFWTFVVYNRSFMQSNNSQSSDSFDKLYKLLATGFGDNRAVLIKMKQGFDDFTTSITKISLAQKELQTQISESLSLIKKSKLFKDDFDKHLCDLMSKSYESLSSQVNSINDSLNSLNCEISKIGVSSNDHAVEMCMQIDNLGMHITELGQQFLSQCLYENEKISDVISASIVNVKESLNTELNKLIESEGGYFGEIKETLTGVVETLHISLANVVKCLSTEFNDLNESENNRLDVLKGALLKIEEDIDGCRSTYQMASDSVRDSVGSKISSLEISLDKIANVVNLQINNLQGIVECQTISIDNASHSVIEALNGWIPAANAFVNALPELQENTSKAIREQSEQFFNQCIHVNEETLRGLISSIANVFESLKIELQRFTDDENKLFSGIRDVLNSIGDEIESCHIDYGESLQSLQNSIENNVTNFASGFMNSASELIKQIEHLKVIGENQKKSLDGLSNSFTVGIENWVPTAEAFVSALPKMQETTSNCLNNHIEQFFTECNIENKRTVNSIKEALESMVEQINKEFDQFTVNETERFEGIKETLRTVGNTIVDCSSVFEDASDSLKESVENINKEKMVAYRLTEDEKKILNRIENLCRKK